MKKYFKNINFTVGFSLIIFLAIVLITSFIYIPYDPNLMDSSNVFSKPSLTHLLGTDNFGRDIFSRILKGSQMTFIVGISSVFIGGTIGIMLGAIVGYYGGIIDKLIMHVIDALMAFPGVILALVLITLFGSSITNISLALGIMAIPRFTRIVRSGFIQAKNMDYVKSSIAKGASSLRIMFIHIMPNITSSIIVTASLSFSSAVLSEAGLSYLGLGIQPPDPSWGKMLYESQAFFLMNPWYAIVPGIMITAIVLGFNLLGDGIRDVNDGR